MLQPGAPPVEGFSDPAWMALLDFGHRLGLFDHGTWFGVPDYVALAVAILAVHLALFLALRFSGGIIRVIRDSGIDG